MTIGTAISRVRNGIKEVSRDSYYTNRLLWNTLLTNYIRFLNQKPNIHSLDVFTTIDVETESVNLLENTCVPLDCWGCRIKVEDVLETKHGMVFRYITTPDRSIPFKLVSPKLFTKKADKTKGNTHYAFLEGEYLYFNKCYPCIKISYLAKDGVTTSCCKLDNALNIPDYLLDISIKGAIQDLAPSLQKPVDRTSDKN